MCLILSHYQFHLFFRYTKIRKYMYLIHQVKYYMSDAFNSRDVLHFVKDTTFVLLLRLIVYGKERFLMKSNKL